MKEKVSFLNWRKRLIGAAGESPFLKEEKKGHFEQVGKP